MAEKVLSADLRNVIKKVGDGVPLSPAEREIMERHLAASAEMADLAKARSAALLRRWATGSKFSKAELKELEAHFSATEGKPGKPVRLTAERYDHPLRVYAEKIWPDKDLKSSVRKMKRWVQLGKKDSDLPPFDDLPRLAAWYERHHRYDQAPPELRRFERVESEAPPSSPQGDPAEGDAEADRLPSMTLDLDATVASDMALRQVRALASAIYEQMEIALKHRNVTQYRTLRQEWLPLINTQRQWEKDLLGIQEGKGEVLRTRVVNSELVRIFTTSGQSFFNGLLKVLQDHAPQLSPEEQRRIALEHRDLVFTHLRGSRFETAWTPAPL
jgi:hypothetical protein